MNIQPLTPAIRYHLPQPLASGRPRACGTGPHRAGRGSPAVQAALLVLATTALLVLGACTSTQGWQQNGLPASRYLVGGGFEINWEAPSAGTVIVAEFKSAKILQTRHLDSGDSFEFKVPEEGIMEKVTGLAPSDLKIQVYFIPDKH